MKVGTKSLLFGYHQFLLHPLMVWVAWLKLYGWTWDLRIVVSFFVHDIGYWGCPNMDGEEGKDHPYVGAFVMSKLFDPAGAYWDLTWFKFALCHSRTTARQWRLELSRLGYADKLAFNLYPLWLVWVLGGLSGENREYMALDKAQSFSDWTRIARGHNIHTLKEAELWK